MLKHGVVGFIVVSGVVGLGGCDGVVDERIVESVAGGPPALAEETDPSLSGGLVAQVRALIAENGITPLEPPPDASPELVALGEALFYDKILSGNKDVSCSTCHHPRLGTTDHLTMNRGVHGVGIGPERVGAAVGGRTTQPVWNLHKMPVQLTVDGKVFLNEDGYVLPLGAPFIPFEWQDAAFDPDFANAAGQAIMPEVTDQEMLGFPGENDLTTECVPQNPPFAFFLCVWGRLQDRLGAIPEYVSMFEAAYPGVPFAEMTFAHAGNAIAAYEMHAFYSNDTPWDRFVGRWDPDTEAYVPGDDSALTAAQLKGARHFLDADRGNCTSCHAGNGFTDQDFHKTLQPQFGPGGTVPGGDPPNGLDDFGRMRISGDPDDKYAWRTPPLRNVMLTGPWGRQSHYNDIRDFLRHYRNPEHALLEYDITESVDEVAMHSQFLENRLQIIDEGTDPLLDTVHVNKKSIDHLVAFLHALTDSNSAGFPDLVPDSVPSGLPVDK